MKAVTILSSLSFVVLSAGCSSSSSAPSGPVIDSLDVPPMTTSMTINTTSGPVTGPGVILTFSAHDDSATITTLHVVFTENGMDTSVPINASPSIMGQQVQLVLPHPPSGAHPLAIRVSDTKNQSSPAIMKTITVP